MPRTARTAVLLISLSLLAGCAKRVAAPPANVGYESLREALAGRDAAPLQGRRIVLDPGHGGIFRGVVGRDGLAEADANLGVGLYLRGLLEAAGSTVVMTRTSDRDFLTPADSTLAADLAARSALIDSLRPDVFLSLHHNSNAELDRARNETQTYYPAGRDGADLDLARAVHRQLVRNLGIRPARIMPGNFSVLRNAPAGVPAVLGEPSMLSNPAVEARLTRADKLELEAKAYFLGLLDFFAGGRPRWLAKHPDGFPRAAARWRFDPGPDGPPLDPATVVLAVAGQDVPISVAADGRTVRWRPTRPLPDGPLPVVLTGANVAGRAAPVLRDTLRTSGSTARVRLRGILEGAGTGRPPRILLSWENRDATGRLVPLRHPVRYVAADEPADGGILLGAAGRRSSQRLLERSAVPAAGDLVAVRRPGAPRRPTTVPLDTLPPGRRWVALTGRALDGPPRRQRLHDAVTADDATAAAIDPGVPWLPLGPRDTVWLERPGSLPLVRTPADAWRDTLAWTPLLPALHGRTVVIDPAGGGPDDQGLAPMGTPGRELNLRTARRLAALLRGAGARAVLTRRDPGWVPDETKVLLANRTDADLFLTVARHEGDAPRLRHHHGSRNGSRWARLTAAALTAAWGDSVPVGPSSAYLLRHTAPPALLCELPRPATEDAEDRARTPAASLAEAASLFRAVAAYFADTTATALPPGWDPDSFMSRHRARLPHRDDIDLVRIDGQWTWLPGGPRMILPPTGSRRTLEIRAGDEWWLVVADPDVDTARILLYGRGERALDPAATEPPEHEVLHDAGSAP